MRHGLPAAALYLLGATALAALAASFAPRVSAQAPAIAPAASEPTFEVASVKRTTTEGPSSVRVTPGGMLTVTNNVLLNIIRNAYNLSGAQIVDVPGWLQLERFDIVAKASAPFTQAEGMLMLRTLLAERFSLVVHTDRREMPVYALSLVKKDGTLGPQMRRTNVDCVALYAAVRAGGPMPTPGPGGSLPCGISVRSGLVTGSSVSMEQLTRNLAGGVGRMIVDQTGLQGYYDLTLSFAAEPGLAPPGAQLPAPDPSAASLFTAVQEQLGLKLEPTRAPIEVLVIDRVERPTAD